MEPNGEMSLPSEAVGPAAHTGNCSQTEIKVERVTHSWTVKNFSHCYQEYLENFVYLHRNDETFTWSIKIYPKGNGENNKDFVFLCLNKVTSSGGKASKIGFKSRFLLKSAENKDIEMRIHPNPSHSDYVSYIKRDVLFPQIQPKDQIIVLVEIDVAVETVTVNLDDQIQAINSEQQLLEDYQRILREDILTDFTIRVGERELRCHRAILAARSPVFAAMFMHADTNEAKNGVLVIEDLDMEVVRELVNYIYAGRFSRDVGEQAGDLLIAADKYRLEQLKAYCENVLVEALNLDNACQLLILAEIYNAKLLKTRALRFITQHTKAVTNTTGWAELLKQYSHLVTEVVRNFDKSDAQMLMAPISSGLPPGSV